MLIVLIDFVNFFIGIRIKKYREDGNVNEIKSMLSVREFFFI